MQIKDYQVVLLGVMIAREVPVKMLLLIVLHGAFHSKQQNLH